jgi:hypothetical protein
MVTPETVDDLTFVLTEAHRFARFTWHELVQYVQKNDESMIHRLGDDRRLLFIGGEAYGRFWTIAERELVRRDLHDRADFGIAAFSAALRDEFVVEYVDRGCQPDIDSADSIISRALTTCRQAHRLTNHHLPCVITHDSAPAHFSVGPVTFRPTNRFFDYQADALDRYLRGEFTDEKLRGSDPAAREMHTASAREFYERYPWVASVTVDSSNPTVSERRAEQAVDAALDVLRLFFPEPYAAYLHRARSSAHVRKSARIINDEFGDVEITVTYASDKAPPWLEALLSRFGDYVRDAGEWLVAHVQRGTASDLQRRFLDALHWYGQAIRDETPAGRLVKLFAALERLTVAEEKSGGIRSVVVNRAALLAKGYDGLSYRGARKAVNQYYIWRSHLMHGSHSPYIADVQQAAADATGMVRWCIVEALIFFRYLDSGGVTTDAQLEDTYKRWYVNVSHAG